MGQQQKKDNGNFMGESTKTGRTKGSQHNGEGSGRSGGLPEGLPNQKNDTPKKGIDTAPNFQMLRNQEPGKGRI